MRRRLFGPQQTIEGRSFLLNVDVRFTPKNRHLQCKGHVRFGPIADMACLLDHFVGAGEHRRRNSKAERLCGLEIDDQLVLGRGLHR